MSDYFKQIIFSPLPKPVSVDQHYDINNKPMSVVPPIPQQIVVKPKEQFDFWFIEITDSKTEAIRTQLMAACPVCDTTFVVRYKIKSEAVMRHALKVQGAYYRGYVKDHCPSCYPGNPVPKEAIE